MALRPGVHRLFRPSATLALLASGVSLFSAVAPATASGEISFSAPFRTLATDAWPYSVAVTDLDGDGHLDLVSCNEIEGTISVFLGNGDGTYRPRADYDCGPKPVCLVAADLNGDGMPDVAIANSGAPTISVLLGHGDGSFGPRQDYATGPVAASRGRNIFAGDFNGDGKLDLIASNQDVTLSLLIGNGNGSFNAPISVELPAAFVTADVNGDGLLDLLASNGGGVVVRLGIGNGAFGPARSFPVTGASSQLAIGDLSGDSRPDVVITNPGFGSGNPPSHIAVMLGNGDGTFGAATYYETGEGPSGVTIGDLNGDGRLDVVSQTSGPVTSFGGTLSVLLGNGDGTLQPHRDLPSGHVPGATPVIADLDQDGKADIAIPCRNGSTIVLYKGNGDGSFGGGRTFAVPDGPPLGVVVGDLQGDGNPDVVASIGSSGSNEFSVFLGDGLGSFSPGTRFSDPGYYGSFGLADLNGDGKLDLIQTNNETWDQHGDSTLSVWLGNGDATFGSEHRWPTGLGPADMARGDFNEDGHPDIAVCNQGYVPPAFNTPGQTISILLGIGDGGFQDQAILETPPGPNGIQAIDLDRDGHPDLMVSSGTSLSVRLGHGDGSFGTRMDWQPSPHMEGFRLADLNGDGVPDLAFGHGNEPDSLAVALGNGDGTFTVLSDEEIGYDQFVQTLADLDLDGRPDLLLASPYSNSVSIRRGNGDGTFQPATPGFGLGAFSFVSGIADFDHDGLPDLITTDVIMNTLWVLSNTTRGAVTSVLASLASLGAEPGRVRISWVSTAAPTEARVLRAESAGSWKQVATLLRNRDRWDFVDTDVIAGHRYGYRLELVVNGTPRVADEEWVDVPAAAAFALEGFAPNPSQGSGLVAFSLPTRERAKLELFDLQGRLVRTRDVGDLGPGSHRIDLAQGARLAPGLYLVRLSGTHGALSRRAIVMH